MNSFATKIKSARGELSSRDASLDGPSLDSQIFELRNAINKQVNLAPLQVSKANVDHFGLKQSNVGIRPVARKANFRHEETVSLVNCEQTMTNLEAKRSLVSSSVLPRLLTDAEADVAERVVLDYQQSF